MVPSYNGTFNRWLCTLAASCWLISRGSNPAPVNESGPDGGAAALEAQLKYRVPHQPSLDGNTVELHIEQAQFADNAVRDQATLTFLGSKFSGLKNAITGGR